MTAILLKELRSYFKSLFGWIFLAVFTFFEGAFFVGYNIQYGSPYISDSLNSLNSVADSKSAEASDAHTEKASELRQDNGTVATVCIVFAVVGLIYIMFRQFLKK